ncbi:MULTISPECIES: caspase family protein [unclassified Saccharothrix]|uniref:caspase family protein n=1 Tax=unclassified Saccharothrix TaxID=2593673 RepID=UPI00307FBAF9
MARKALLIGAQTGGLTGVANDVAAMADTLALWGFHSTRCEEENASRAGILDAYERLIGQARPDDAVVVYYSGHGAYSPDPERGWGTPGHKVLQLIEPTDFTASTEEDFRGITALELSVLLARLTERTRNVTVILDCCHSAHMSRDRDPVVKGRSRPVPAHLIRAHLDTLRREGLPVDLPATGNPHAVRIVACGPEQLAGEAANADGVRMGYLTDALTRSLTELRDSGLAVSWATVVDRVRQRVLAAWPSQRPEVEGPARRIVFDTTETDPVATFPVSPMRDRVRIAGAPLFGVRPGDEFVVMPDDSPEADDTRKLGDVVVGQVDAQAAYGVLSTDAPVPLGARAHLVRAALPALPVQITGNDPRLATVARLVEPVPIVAVAEDADVRVEAEPAGLVVHDTFGPLHAPQTADTVVANLKRVAQAQALRRLTEDPWLALATPVSIKFARVIDGTAVPLPRSGAVVHSGQSICIEVRNQGTTTIYVSLLDIGVSHQISVLNPSAPSGVRLDAGSSYTFGGHDHTGRLAGLAVSWPHTVPARDPRPETIVALVSAEPTDTRVLEQSGVRSNNWSRLERYLRQLGTAGIRETAPEAARPVRFAVHTVDFDLVPTPAPAPETSTFQVDDRPTTPSWPRSARECEVAVHLSDLVVHHNRRSRWSNVRLDALVITNDTFHVHTEFFEDIKDGERLPFPTTPIFQGTARSSLDVAVWMSPAAPFNLATHLPKTSPNLIDTAHQALITALGTTTGLYRTTLTAAEHFGLARTVGDGSVRAQDFSFRCTVTEPSVRVGVAGSTHREGTAG